MLGSKVLLETLLKPFAEAEGSASDTSRKTSPAKNNPAVNVFTMLTGKVFWGLLMGLFTKSPISVILNYSNKEKRKKERKIEEEKRKSKKR